MSACSSGCATPGVHATFGECLRAKNIEVSPVEAHKFNQARNTEINDYVRAREAGLQPDTVFKNDVRKAWKITDATGQAYRGDKPMGGLSVDS